MDIHEKGKIFRKQESGVGSQESGVRIIFWILATEFCIHIWCYCLRRFYGKISVINELVIYRV